MTRVPDGLRTAVKALIAVFVLAMPLLGLNTKFHNAPDCAKKAGNRYEGQATAQQAGKKLYARYCRNCHGRNARGSGNIPGLVDGVLESVTRGEVFWFVTK